MAGAEAPPWVSPFNSTVRNIFERLMSREKESSVPSARPIAGYVAEEIQRSSDRTVGDPVMCHQPQAPLAPHRKPDPL